MIKHLQDRKSLKKGEYLVTNGKNILQYRML